MASILVSFAFLDSNYVRRWWRKPQGRGLYPRYAALRDCSRFGSRQLHFLFGGSFFSYLNCKKGRGEKALFSSDPDERARCSLFSRVSAGSSNWDAYWRTVPSQRTSPTVKAPSE